MELTPWRWFGWGEVLKKWMEFVKWDLGMKWYKASGKSKQTAKLPITEQTSEVQEIHAF